MRASDRPSRLAGARTLRCLAAALAMACLPASAQDNNATASREREALRRAQAALNDTRRELAALQAERASLLRDKDAAAAEALRARQARDALQSELRAAQQQAAALRGEQQSAVDRLRTERQDDAARSAERDRQAAAEAARLQQQLAERSRTVAAVTALLERATQALAEAETQNRQLHAMAVEAVERWRGKTPADAALQSDPLLGLTQVRIENVAEDLRSRADALRLAPAGR